MRHQYGHEQEKVMSNPLPLHSMIRSVISGAKEKLAAEEGGEKKVNKLLKFEKKEHGHIPSVEEEKAELPKEEAEKIASFTDPEFVEKLASACDYISANVGAIEPPSAISQALAKVAEEGSPRGAGKGPGSLELNKPTPGHQSYKKDHPKTEDPSASQAGTPLSTADKPGGKTQLENNAHHAAGQESGSVPHAKYPAAGPIVAEKHASIKDLLQASGKLRGGLGGAAVGAAGGALAGAAGAEPGHRLGGAAKGAVGGAATGGAAGAALGHGLDKLTAHAAQRPPQLAGMPKAAQAAAEHILLKLAGEDVTPASISASGSANPLAGKGQLQSFDATQAPPKASGGPTSSDGNQGRTHIKSNESAIDYTKKDAKGPQKTQMKEVLTEPMQSRATDSKVHENLRNADKGGVKIAVVRGLLAKVAAAGCTCGGKGECEFDLLKEAANRGAERMKTANAGMGYGGGMGAMADAGAGADGCTCGNTGECRVCKLKAELSAAKAGPMAAGGAVTGGAPATGRGVEKDSTGMNGVC
jgi:hypothetical protein